jgi:heterodisulfide reductase subunit C2
MSTSGTHDHASSPATLAAELTRKTGQNPAECYQCGKCSAGCPMAVETRLRPHDVMRLIGGDRRETLLQDESIWLCLTCETCTARCPNGCDPARLIDALREMSIARAPRAVGAFHRSFLDQVKANGRMFEFGLVIQYKLRSGKLLNDALSTPGMIARGKLKFVPSPIKGVSDVRRIFEACEKESANGSPAGNPSGRDQ